jgi:hypothetical protein
LGIGDLQALWPLAAGNELCVTIRNLQVDKLGDAHNGDVVAVEEGLLELVDVQSLRCPLATRNLIGLPGEAAQADALLLDVLEDHVDKVVKADERADKLALCEPAAMNV